MVELWQADNNGAYLHSASPVTNRDPNFQGIGQFLTGSTGEYRFRTIKPGIYPGRTRHFHVGVTLPGRARWTTQLYFAGDPHNASDGILQSVTNAAERAAIVRSFDPIPGSALGEIAGTFDMVMGFTPGDVQHPGGGLTLAGAAVAGPPGGRERTGSRSAPTPGSATKFMAIPLSRGWTGPRCPSRFRRPARSIGTFTRPRPMAT